MKLKKILALSLCALLALFCLAGCNSSQGIGTHHAEITVKDMGVITVELDGRIIFDLAERLKDNPSSRLEIGG